MATAATARVNQLLVDLEHDGISLMPDFLSQAQLESVVTAFESRLRHQRWNDVDGYEKTMSYRHMVNDILAVDQGFVDAALHPGVAEALREYLGHDYELVEAKGWKSLPTKRDFHGWHGDAWYDQDKVASIPREVKLGIYLTDVNSGFFEYVRGSHRKQAPRQFRSGELAIDPAQVVQARGRAGSAFLFDTTGIHRQSVPILERRYAVFFNYHSPSIPLQKEDVEYYRYHPLLLNAALLGDLSAEQRRVLGFGNKRNYIHAYVAKERYPKLHRAYEATFDLQIFLDGFSGRVRERLHRIVSSARRPSQQM